MKAFVSVAYNQTVITNKPQSSRNTLSNKQTSRGRSKATNEYQSHTLQEKGLLGSRSTGSCLFFDLRGPLSFEKGLGGRGSSPVALGRGSTPLFLLLLPSSKGVGCTYCKYPASSYSPAYNDKMKNMPHINQTTKHTRCLPFIVFCFYSDAGFSPHRSTHLPSLTRWLLWYSFRWDSLMVPPIKLDTGIKHDGVRHQEMVFDCFEDDLQERVHHYQIGLLLLLWSCCWFWMKFGYGLKMSFLGLIPVFHAVARSGNRPVEI